jgi:glycosyltransferase involved in cell wall biosynthesis
MKPLVTIGIPCFNSSRWLAQAIESALGQTWPEKEVIVVDDGSTDESPDIARRFGDRIRFLRGENHGGNHARNLALNAAQGVWIQFLDADDYLEAEKIAEQLAETAEGAEADVLYSPTWIEDLGKNTRLVGPIDSDFDLYSQWLSWQLPQTGGALWRKAALDGIGGWKEGQPCCQEHELYLRSLERELRFRFAPTPHAVYRIWSEQTVCRRDPRQVIRMRTQLMDALRDWMTTHHRWTPEHARIAGQAFFEMARSLARHDLAEADAYFQERKSCGLIHLAGPAAPPAYRLAHRLLGFTGAEKLAAARR